MAFRLGSIEPFDAGTGDWSTYKARLEQFLVANDVEGEPKQVATVLTLIGGPTYGLLVNLLAPEEPAKQKLADIFATLDGHFAPKPLVIAERYRFNKRDQRPGEPLNDYVAELRRLARHCEFGSNLNEHLRDRLVCGLNNPATIRKLLAEANLDLKKAIHIAHATETAARDANELHKETPVPTHQLRAQSAKFKGRYQTHGHGSKPCYRCGGTDHRQEDCPHKNSTCDYCRKTGHIDAACRKKRADQPDSTAPSSRSTQTKPTSRHTPRSAARAHNLEAEDYSEDEFFIHHNEQDTEHKRTEIWIEPSINGRSLKMELDTGSALSIIPLRLYSAHFADLELSPSSVVLKTYTGERVRPTGALDVTVECNEQKVQAQLLVVDTCGPPLFGRDWLKLIRIDWPRVFRVEKVKREEEPPIKQAENLTPATKVKLEALLDKYADILARIEASCAPAKDICSCATTQCQNFAKHDLCRTHFAARSRRNFHVWRATASFRQSHGATGQRRSSLSSRRTGPCVYAGISKLRSIHSSTLSSTRCPGSTMCLRRWQEGNDSVRSISSKHIFRWRWTTSQAPC